MDRIQPFRVMALLAEAKQLEASGRSIIHMEVGEPDFDTPQPIIEAGIQALKDGRTHYTPAVGDKALRQAISDYYRQQFNVHIPVRRILVTPGASGALQLVLSILINPADQVVMADPGYPCNRNFIYLLGGEPVTVEVSSQTHFQIQTQQLPAVWSDKCRVLLLASPSNPTGTIIKKNEMKAMIDYVHSHNAAVIVDEIYQGLCYEHKAYSALELSEDVFVINSFSKYFGMTGWRLGWIVAPDCYIDDLDKLAQNLYLAASTPAQVAAISAFSAETRQILDERRTIFRQRRDYLLPELEKLGFRIPVVPDGAFYIYADCSQLTDDSLHFCQQALHQAGVAITPGLDFGANQPQNYIRFAYTTDLAGLKEGIRRLREFIQDYTSADNSP
jgi:aspartate/methionine/tyrosine aminotransferase